MPRLRRLRDAKGPPPVFRSYFVMYYTTYYITSKKEAGSFLKMADCGTSQVNSGDGELDEKIAEWLSLDKVKYAFHNIIYVCQT